MARPSRLFERQTAQKTRLSVFLRQYQLGQVQRVAKPRSALLASQSLWRDSPDASICIAGDGRRQARNNQMVYREISSKAFIATWALWITNVTYGIQTHYFMRKNQLQVMSEYP